MTNPSAMHVNAMPMDRLAAASDERRCETMHVAFERTPEDLDAAVARLLDAATRRRRSAILFTITALAMFAAILLAVVLIGLRLHIPQIVAMVAIPLATAWAIVWLAYWRKLSPKHRAAKAAETYSDRPLLAREQITISQTGISSVQPLYSSRCAWDCIESIECGEAGVWLKTGSLLVDYFIPRRAFESDAAMGRFSDQALSWRNAARNWHERCPECDYDLRGDHAEGCPECGWRRAAKSSGQA